MDALVVYATLETRFDDNHIMMIFEVLDLTNMPLCQAGLANWDDVVDLEVLCVRYGVQWELNERRIPPLDKPLHNLKSYFI